jgi:hypothetical protein
MGSGRLGAMTLQRAFVAACVAIPVLVLTACGGSSQKSVSTVPTTTPSTTVGTTTPVARQPSPPGALQAEAAAKATGDVPDNQVYLEFQNPVAGYAMKYPEGWAQLGTGDLVTFHDKNNIVRVVIAKAPPPTLAGVRARSAKLKGAHVVSFQQITLAGAPAVKVVYTTQSAPNPVTGKRVTLVVDRYYLGRAGKEAIVDLGTPQGVDNVDAYRMMIESFRWS